MYIHTFYVHIITFLCNLMCFCHFHFFLYHRHCRRLYIFIVSFLFPPFWRFPSSSDLCFSLLVVNFHFPSINRWMWVRILPARVHNVVDSWINLNCHNTHTYFQCQSSCYGKILRNNHGRRNEMTWKTLRKKVLSCCCWNGEGNFTYQPTRSCFLTTTSGGR